MSPVPGFPLRGKDAPDRAYEHLAKYHGIDATVARHRLHKLKAMAGLGPPDDVMIGRTGGYNRKSGTGG